MARIRTFIAIDIPDDIRAAGQRLIRELEPLAEGARWVQPKNMHLTLKFLGDVDERELPEVCRLVQEATADLPAFPADCGSVGVFPDPSRPSTLWMGVCDANDELAALHERVETALRGLGFPGDHRHFQGHITLGRLRRATTDAAPIQRFLARHQATPFGSLLIEEVTLYRSELHRSGPEYAPVGRFPLA